MKVVSWKQMEMILMKFEMAFMYSWRNFWQTPTRKHPAPSLAGVRKRLCSARIANFLLFKPGEREGGLQLNDGLVLLAEVLLEFQSQTSTVVLAGSDCCVGDHSPRSASCTRLRSSRLETRVFQDLLGLLWRTSSVITMECTMEREKTDHLMTQEREMFCQSHAE